MATSERRKSTKCKIPEMDADCDIASIDIIERHLHKDLLGILLKDMSTGRNILWACDDYSGYGCKYKSGCQITHDLIARHKNKNLIQPRILKEKCYQKERTRTHAEVFTPSWICNEMNNYCDEEWFGRSNVFNNVNDDHTWMATNEPIFPSGSNQWHKYVLSKRLEITCGEAPYLVSPYDTTNGKIIPIEQRIGQLDRKLRVINENMNSERYWFDWVIKAYQSTYGYEYQGDNLLLARENLLYTFIDNYKFKFGVEPTIQKQKKIAQIIAWNIWQMDGLSDCTPTGTIDNPNRNLFDTTESQTTLSMPCRIMDWENNQPIYFKDIKKGSKMKFFATAFNPPYQISKDKTETQTQTNSSWIYQYFQFAADDIAECSCVIYPFGGWFDAPDRLNGLGNRILNDKRTIMVKAYEGTTDRRAWYRTDKQPNPVFGSGVNLSAGVSIVLRNNKEHDGFKYSNRIYSDKEVFVPFERTVDITPNPVFIEINNKLIGNKLNDRIKKGIFGIESDFVEKNPTKVSFNKQDWKAPIQLLTNDKSGSSGRARLYWTDKAHLEKGQEYTGLYKIVMASAYPKKTIVSGEVSVSNVKKRIMELIEELPPHSAFGRSRLALFMSKSKAECENFKKYLQTNFFAGLVLQEPNRSSSFGYVIPDQDFSDKSDIDWSKSIVDIDKQLYKKYKLDKSEIAFIESGSQEVA